MKLKLKKNFFNQAENLVTFWQYVIAHSIVPNLIAEANFIKLFSFEGCGETECIITNFLAAVEEITKDIISENDIITQHTEPNKIKL